MWVLILLICSLPVSGALWANKNVRGVVGRAITIECYYDEGYQSYVKYWCDGTTVSCSDLVKTNDQHGRRGRMSITDNKTARIFVVTMEDLRPGDTGWYSCGIEQSGVDPKFAVKLQISYESVSVPVLRYLSPPNASCFGGSVSVSCESVQGSLPIQYTWYEKTSSEDSKISDTNKLDLHCQSFKQQHHQYYCTASNTQGQKSSGMVNVSVFNRAGKTCRYVTQISDIGPEYSCEGFSTVSPTTTHSTGTNTIDNRNQTSGSKLPSLIYIVLGVLAALIVVLAVSLLFYRMQNNKDSNCIICRGGDDALTDNQQLAAAEGSTLYASVEHIRRSSVETPSEGTAQLSNDENEITYARVQFQKKSTTRSSKVARHSVNNEDSVIYSGIKVQSQPPKNNREPPSLDTPQDSEMAIYANARS